MKDKKESIVKYSAIASVLFSNENKRKLDMHEEQVSIHTCTETCDRTNISNSKAGSKQQDGPRTDTDRELWEIERETKDKWIKSLFGKTPAFLCCAYPRFCIGLGLQSPFLFPCSVAIRRRRRRRRNKSRSIHWRTEIKESTVLGKSKLPR